MTQLQITFDIIQTDQQLEKLFLLEIVKELNARIPKIMPRMTDKMRVATFNFLKATDTYQSLVSGGLAYHFGLPTGGRKQRIDTIIQAVANRMEVEFIPVKLISKQFKKGIRFRVLLRDLSEVLTLPESLVLTEKGELLEWLHWLLELGDKIIINEYEIELGSGRGRSGGAIMVPEKSGSWRVPPKYAGTISKNWLTRALTKNGGAYLSIIEEIIKKEMQGM